MWKHGTMFLVVSEVPTAGLQRVAPHVHLRAGRDERLQRVDLSARAHAVIQEPR